MNPKNIKAFLFDMDDTIFDSERLNVELIGRYFRENWGLTPDREDSEYVFGHAWQDIYRQMDRKYSLGAGVERIRDGVLELKRAYLASHPLITADGLAEVLALPVRKAIVSGSADIEIEMMLESAGIADRFEFAVATEEGKGKPLPDGFLTAVERLDIAPSEALAFEDSSSGIESAKRAGVPVVFIAQFAFRDRSDRADYAFPTLRAFHKFFTSK